MEPLTSTCLLSSIVDMVSQTPRPLYSGESVAAEWESNGYFRVDQFISIERCRQLVTAGQHFAHDDQHAVVRYESNLSETLPADQRVSKLYRFHRAQPFRSLATSPHLVRLVRPIIDGDFDVFLSQVVWKVPGALGQPWHQDSSIFPFEPSRPVVAIWLALTEATESNSCLRVVPGSHKTRVAPHSRNPSGPTAGRYVTLDDQDHTDYCSLTMSPGDLVIFDSHLVHSSGDNLSQQARIALCLHFAAAGTVDRTAETFGQSPYNDWMPAWRTEGTIA
jgi:phytanoyl-CoA hydroxylase